MDYPRPELRGAMFTRVVVVLCAVQIKHAHAALTIALSSVSMPLLAVGLLLERRENMAPKNQAHRLINSGLISR